MSHLLFVDDMLIFCDVSSKQIRNLQCIFLCFEAPLGLRNNLAKLEIVPLGEVEDVEELASILGCSLIVANEVFGLVIGCFL